jgi:glucose/arabinose dehydrogenase
VAALQGLAYERVATGLPFAVFATAPEGDERLFIVTKDGQIWIHDGSGVVERPFLDIRDLVRNDGEQGLLGLAFHPAYPDDPRFFVHYSDDAGDTVLAEYRVGADPDTAEAGGTVVYTTDQPAGNHNGGMVQFGPDGNLYLALGDGGGANDRFGQGQRSDTPLGAILRFDVSTPGLAVAAADPPFEDPFVWAYGLRNPWRFDMDRFEDGTDLIYVADVGQNAFEEVTVAPFTPGLNHGWPVTEALHCFSPSSGCDVAGLTLPVIEVEHGDAGTCSITGGFVYRGTAIPELAGHYFYSDFCGGYLRSFRFDGAGATEPADWTDQVGSVGQVSSFGEDADGELYVTTAGGDVFKIVPIR